MSIIDSFNSEDFEDVHDMSLETFLFLKLGLFLQVHFTLLLVLVSVFHVGNVPYISSEPMLLTHILVWGHVQKAN